MHKQIVVYSYHRILFINEKECTIDIYDNLIEYLKCGEEEKQPNTKEHILYVPII